MPESGRQGEQFQETHVVGLLSVDDVDGATMFELEALFPFAAPLFELELVC